MVSSSINLADIEKWDADKVDDVFRSVGGLVMLTKEVSEKTASLDVFNEWGGESAVEARKTVGGTVVKLDEHSKNATIVRDACNTAVGQIVFLKKLLKDIHTDVMTFNLTLDEVANTVSVTEESVSFDSAAQEKARDEVEIAITDILRVARLVDEELALAIGLAMGTVSEDDFKTKMQDIGDGLKRISSTDWWKPTWGDVQTTVASEIISVNNDALGSLMNNNFRNEALKDIGISEEKFNAMPASDRAELLKSDEFKTSFQGVLKESGLAGKVMKSLGPIGIAAGFGLSLHEDLSNGMDPVKAVVTEGAGAGAGIGAGIGAAALVGAAGGSAIPGLGTAVGLIAGLTVGYFAPKLLQKLWG